MEMIDGGKRAGDKNLKERRKQKKKAAENRIKALGEALGESYYLGLIPDKKQCCSFLF